jgi:hypothetical protein
MRRTAPESESFRAFSFVKTRWSLPEAEPIRASSPGSQRAERRESLRLPAELVSVRNCHWSPETSPLVNAEPAHSCGAFVSANQSLYFLSLLSAELLQTEPSPFLGGAFGCFRVFARCPLFGLRYAAELSVSVQERFWSSRANTIRIRADTVVSRFRAILRARARRSLSSRTLMSSSCLFGIRSRPFLDDVL